ncbi:MAG: DUF2497 domain-containing protein [Proteobacteria bacterium]|nr:DUF2497 domain-containing protein [Pseudomonadota bacterium]
MPSWLFPSSPEPSVADRGPNFNAPVQNGIKPFFGGPLAEPAKAAEAKADAGRQQKPIDLGAIVPQRVSDANGSAGKVKPQSDSRPAQKLPEWRARGAQRETPVQATPQMLAPPEEPTQFVQPAASPATPALSELSTARVLPSSPAEPVVTSTVLPPLEPSGAAEPVAQAAVEPAKVEVEADRVSVSVPAAEAAVAAEAAPRARVAELPAGVLPVAEPAHVAKAEAPAAQPLSAPPADPAPLFEAATEPVGATVPAPVGSIAAAAPTRDLALPVVGAAPVAKPTMIVDRGPRTKVAGSDLVASPSQGGAVKTLEDTVVDLLRPMIRQWLDENMPRMVEKALRVELAESVRAKLEQQKL